MAFIKSRRTLKGITYHLVDLINGKEVATKLHVQSKTEATKYLMKYLGDKMDNRPNSLLMEKVNFKEFVESRYLPYAKIHKTEKTIKVDLKNLKPLFAKWGSSNLNDITADSISLFQVEAINHRNLSKKSVNNQIGLLSAILRMAYKQNIIVRMPEIKMFKLEQLSPRGFSDYEVKLFLEKAMNREDKTLYNFLFIFLNTGMRLSELQNLKWEDVDLLAKQLMVKRSKNKSFRVIPLNADLENHLELMKKQVKHNQVYLFEVASGVPQTENFYYRRFNRLLVSLNIKGNIHALRHTFASRLVQKGVSLYMVQKLLGHNTIRTTERYARLRPIDLAEAVKVLESHGTTTEPSQNNLLKLA